MGSCRATYSGVNESVFVAQAFPFCNGRAATARRKPCAMYDTGVSVAQDAAEAVRWFRLAASRGTPWRSSTSGSCTPPAEASRRTMPQLSPEIYQPEDGNAIYVFALPE